jgi:membrane-anchored protein YejM (alkaline phosphatase superfamily)
LPISNYQIPLFIYAPKLIEARETAQLASQIDLAPTLMGLLNLDYTSTFFGRNLLQDNPLPPRVVVGNYQHLGLFDGKDLAILSPRQGLRHDDALTESRESRVPPTLITRAITYYQTASYGYKHQLLDWKAPMEAPVKSANVNRKAPG